MDWARSQSGDLDRGGRKIRLAWYGNSYTEFFEFGTGRALFFSTRIAADDLAQFADSGRLLTEIEQRHTLP